MTTKEKAVVMAYTGVCMLCYDELTYFYKYLDDILGFPIMPHEIPYYANEIKEASKADFISLCINGYIKEDEKR